MFKIGDTVLYGSQGVCIIDDTIQRSFKGEMMRYYVLKPVSQSTSTVFIPMENKELVNKMKRILSQKEIDELFENVSLECFDWIMNDNVRREHFKNILKSGDRKDIVKLIRTIYKKQQELKDIGRKIHASDMNIFNEAEKILYEEFAYVLNIESKDVVSYIEDKMRIKENVN